MSAESFGSASLGAGALELPTKVLRNVRVPDIRTIPEEEQNDLIDLARKCWASERPPDWSRDHTPGAHLRMLDQ